MAKRASLVITDTVLKSNKLDIFLLKDILMYLPSDTKIISFFNYTNMCATYIELESQSFIDTLACSPLPLISVNFTQNLAGHVSLGSLDMSKALAAYQPQSTAICSCSGNSICGICATAAVTIPNLNVTLPSNFYVPPRAGYSIAGANIAGFTQGCNPDWKDYQGLIQSYRYCSKCNKKESEHV